MEYPHTVGELDGKHISMGKAKKCGSKYYNNKCFFSLVLQALIDAEYRFLWVDIGSFDLHSDFNQSKLREKIKDNTLGLRPPKPLE